jgi:hypothetical protein
MHDRKIARALYLVLAFAASNSATANLFAQVSETSNDNLTLVVGTHFVVSAKVDSTPSTQFANERIPAERLNETDRCIDEGALDIAKDYFSKLGQVLERAAYFYIIPDDDLVGVIATCKSLHSQRPQAWARNVKIIAFGRVVPSPDAPALEQSIR